MNLKNYTSSVSSQTTISYIEAYLMEAGASGIMKKVEGGQVVALMFEIEMGNDVGKHLVKLPANVGEVHQYLWKDYVTTAKRPRKVEADFLEQAGRTAWKIVQDWVQVQVSMIKLRQMEPMQVFLPYIWDGNQTYYEFLKDKKFKALPAPRMEKIAEQS
jgi:hypothetical protein